MNLERLKVIADKIEENPELYCQAQFGSTSLLRVHVLSGGHTFRDGLRRGARSLLLPRTMTIHGTLSSRPQTRPSGCSDG